MAELVDARASEARAPEAWEFESPPGDCSMLDANFPGVAGARSAFMRLTRPARYRGLGLAGGPVLDRVSYARRRRFDSPTRNFMFSSGTVR